MQEDFFPAGFGRMKPKPLSSYQRLIMPGFSISTRSLPVSRCILATRGGQAKKKRGSRRAFYLVPGPHISPAVLQSIRWNCQVARISRPKAIRYQAKAA